MSGKLNGNNTVMVGGIMGGIAKGDECEFCYSDCDVYGIGSEVHLGIGKIYNGGNNTSDCYVMNNRKVNNVNDNGVNFGGIIGVDNYNDLLNKLDEEFVEDAEGGCPKLKWES